MNAPSLSRGFVLAAACWVLASPLAAEPAITLGDKTVTVSGLTPGGSVLTFHVDRYPLDEGARIERGETTSTDTDNDGTVVIDLSEDIPPKSIWVAYEEASGKWTFAAPPDLVVLSLEADRVQLLSSTGGSTLDQLAGQNQFLEVLWVRPSGGVWAVSVGDGGDTDRAPASDGALLVEPPDWSAMAGGPLPPASFAPGDLVFAIDSEEMTLYVQTVGATP